MHINTEQLSAPLCPVGLYLAELVGSPSPLQIRLLSLAGEESHLCMYLAANKIQYGSYQLHTESWPDTTAVSSTAWTVASSNPFSSFQQTPRADQYPNTFFPKIIAFRDIKSVYGGLLFLGRKTTLTVRLKWLIAHIKGTAL